MRKLLCLGITALLILSAAGCSSAATEAKKQIKQGTALAAEIGQQYLDGSLSSEEARAKLEGISFPESPITKNINSLIAIEDYSIKHDKTDTLEQYIDRLANYDVEKQWKFYTEQMGYDEKGNNPKEPETGTLEAVEYWLSVIGGYQKIEDAVPLKNGLNRYEYSVNADFYGKCSVIVAVDDHQTIASVIVQAAQTDATQSELTGTAQTALMGLGIDGKDLVDAEVDYRLKGLGSCEIGQYTIDIWDDEGQRIFMLRDKSITG